jgi:hypothetical protein
MKWSGVVIAVILVVGLVPAHASAQDVAASFDELEEQGLLTRGKDIVITFRYEPSAGYREVKAELISLDDSAIVVMVGKLPQGTTDLNIDRREGRYGRYEIEIPEHRVQSIVLPPEGMSRVYGGLIGGAIGVGASALVGIACITANETGDGCALGGSSATALSFAMIGGGATVGALLTGRSRPEVLYRSTYLPAPVTSRFDWTLAPVVMSNQKSAVFTIEW